MKKPYFGRLLTAMVTPFNADGSINYEAGADFADWLLANGSDGLVVEGSTGEASTMDMDEKLNSCRPSLYVLTAVPKLLPVQAPTALPALLIWLRKWRPAV